MTRSSPAATVPAVRFHDVNANGVRLHVATAGPEDGPPLLLLHGWPESRRAWDPVIPLLEEDFRLIVPDQRGFGRSDRPEGTDAYAMGTLVGDVAALIDWTGHERVGLVGHDLGAAVSWASGVLIPNRATRIVAMCAPHPQHFHRVGAGNVGQIHRAFYVWLMHAGEAGERLLSANDFDLLAAWAFAGSGVAPEAIEAYKEEWRQPGAFHAMAEWYRATYTPDLFNPDVELRLPKVRVPVRYVHGERDMAFVAEMATGSGDFVAAEYDEVLLEGASHWVVHERPREVAELIRDWMGRA